jgi:hypothetical protein
MVLGDQYGWRVEDLAGEVALQAADDLGLRQAFVSAALGLGASAWVVSEAAKNDEVERIVGATVTAAVEPIPRTHLPDHRSIDRLTGAWLRWMPNA